MCRTKHIWACGHTERREDRECRRNKSSSGFFAAFKSQPSCDKVRAEKQRSSICRKCESQQVEAQSAEKRAARRERYRDLDDRERRTVQESPRGREEKSKARRTERWHELDDREQRNPGIGESSRHCDTQPYPSEYSSSDYDTSGFYQTPPSSYGQETDAYWSSGPAHRATYHPGQVQYSSYAAPVEYASPRAAAGNRYSVPANNVVDTYLAERAATRPPPSPSSFSGESFTEQTTHYAEQPRGSYDSTRGYQQYDYGAASRAKAKRAERTAHVAETPWQRSVAVPSTDDEPRVVHRMRPELAEQVRHSPRRAPSSGGGRSRRHASSSDRDSSRPPTARRLTKERPEPSSHRRQGVMGECSGILGRRESDDSFACHTARKVESGSRR